MSALDRPLSAPVAPAPALLCSERPGAGGGTLGARGEAIPQPSPLPPCAPDPPQERDYPLLQRIVLQVGDFRVRCPLCGGNTLGIRSVDGLHTGRYRLECGRPDCGAVWWMAEAWAVPSDDTTPEGPHPS